MLLIFILTPHDNVLYAFGLVWGVWMRVSGPQKIIVMFPQPGALER